MHNVADGARSLSVSSAEDVAGCVASLSSKYFMTNEFKAWGNNTTHILSGDASERAFFTGAFLAYSDVEEYIGASTRVGDDTSIDFFVGAGVLSRGTDGLSYYETKKHVFTTIGDTFALSHEINTVAPQMPAISISLTRVFDTGSITSTADTGAAAVPQETWDFVTFCWFVCQLGVFVRLLSLSMVNP